MKLVKLHKVSKEILYHFQCGKCTKWWTISDHHFLAINNSIVCPHCGYKNKIIESEIS